MSSLAIINCACKKQKYPCGPREMYWPSTLFKVRMLFIEPRYDNWVVISSKYGVVTQDMIIEPYDLYLGSDALIRKEGTESYTLAEKKAWGLRVVNELRPLVAQYDQVDGFISSVYHSPFPRPFPLPVRFLKNSAGGGMFKSIKKWKEIVQSSKSTDELIAVGDLIPLIGSPKSQSAHVKKIDSPPPLIAPVIDDLKFTFGYE